MRRLQGFFTLSQTALDNLDELVTECQTALPPEWADYFEPRTAKTQAPSALDFHDLKESDYAAVYALLPLPKASWGLPQTLPPTLPLWDDLVKQIRKRQPNAVEQMEVFTFISQRQKENRREAKAHKTKLQGVRPAAPFLVNKSRVIEALILLGYQLVCKEKVHAVDVKGSAREDASQSSDKLSRSSRRKEIAV